MQLNEENLFSYSPVEWRFSGLTPNVFGLDPLIVLALPAVLLGLSREYGLLYFVFILLFVFLCLYVSIFTSSRSIRSWLQAMTTRYFQRCQWGTE